jgi:hypothetical protein
MNNIVNNSGTFNGSQSLTPLTGSNYNTNSGIVTHAGLIPVV